MTPDHFSKVKTFAMPSVQTKAMPNVLGMLTKLTLMSHVTPIIYTKKLRLDYALSIIIRIHLVYYL